MLLSLVAVAAAAMGAPRAAVRSVANTTEIAPGVLMPAVSMGHSDSSSSTSQQVAALWLKLGGRGLDTANSYNNQDGSYRIEHMWKSKCKDDQYALGGGKKSVRKMTLADGDVNQLDNNGAVVWTLRGSQIYTDPDADIEPVCRPKLLSEYRK